MDENEYGTGYDELTYNSDSNDRSADEVFEDFLSQLDKKERERIERQVATREKVNEAKEKVGGFFAKYTDAAKTGKDALDASKELRRARQEMVVAKTNGCDTKDIERSLAKYELASSEYEKAAERFQDAKVRILEPVTSRFEKAAQSVTDAFDKVGSWIDDKRASVVAAVTNIKEAIAEANAKGGTVVIAQYHSSYGNYIVIDHGDGVSTVYAHCSKLLVSVGDKVKKGQHIGEVGTTGNSTGYHLHFEFRKNGKYTDPFNYIKEPPIKVGASRYNKW